METALEVVETENRFLTAKEIKANVQLIQEVMKTVMKDGTHYGVVPGCGDKKALLKPGAETLLMTFRIAPFPEVEDLSSRDERRYRVRAHGQHVNNEAMKFGSACGECSTDEDKYKWRGAVCKEEYDETPDDRRRMKWKAGWGEKKAKQIMQVRTNPADLANTVLKMAVKRAMVALALTATAASDIFVQDVGDIEGIAQGDTPITMPKQKTEPPPVAADATFRAMKSKYDGVCKGCEEPISKGEDILYSKDAGTFHPKCDPRNVKAQPAAVSPKEIVALVDLAMQAGVTQQKLLDAAGAEGFASLEVIDRKFYQKAMKSIAKKIDEKAKNETPETII